MPHTRLAVTSPERHSTRQWMSVIGYIAQRCKNMLKTETPLTLSCKHKYELEHLPNLFCQYAIITASAEGDLAFL